MIKAIVFDLWRTLIPATIDFVHLAALIKEENVSVPEFVERYEKAVQLKKYKNFEELRKDFFDAFSEEPNELLEQEIYEVYTNRFDKIRFFPETEKVLRKLKAEGYKLGLLSNTESLKAKELEDRLHFKDFFDEIVYSFEINAIKPDPKAFSAILKKLKVKPEEALMVGDSLRSDILGAQGVGMHNCLVNRLGKVLDSAKAKPEFEVKSLDEVFRALGVLNAQSKGTHKAKSLPKKK